MKKKSFIMGLPANIFLVITAFITYFPFWFLIMTSFKTNSQMRHYFWRPALPLHPRNYLIAWRIIDQYILNSFFVTGLSVIGILTIASLSAFAFARFSFPGRRVLFYAVISLMMVPGILTLVPAFVWIKQLRLINTRWALVFPYVSGGQVFAIFILRSFFAGIPNELFDSAKVDGANMFQMYLHIALPLSKAIMGVIAIMNILWTWNDYIWPLVTLIDNHKRTITVGLAFFQGQFQTNYGPQFAGYVIASTPLLVLFFFTMRYFIAGLTSGAIKM